MADGIEGLEDYDPLRLDHQLCFPLYAATNLLQRIYRPLLGPLGLTYTQYLVMLVLWERGPVVVGDLRRCLHLDTGTVTPLLKRMEKAGLVTRRRDPGDERRVVIALTPQGAALRERAEPVPRALSEGLALPLDDSVRLYELTTALVGRLVKAAPKLAA